MQSVYPVKKKFLEIKLPVNVGGKEAFATQMSD